MRESRHRSGLVSLLAVAWAAPWTAFGLAVGLIGMATGGHVQCIDGVIEFWGGGTRWLLRYAPLVRGAAAVTFGHVVLGQTDHDLEYSRAHEQVHVRQYERSGLIFIPAYLACSAWLWLRGRDWYLDNPFEVEAYDSGSRASESDA